MRAFEAIVQSVVFAFWKFPLRLHSIFLTLRKRIVSFLGPQSFSEIMICGEEMAFDSEKEFVESSRDKCYKKVPPQITPFISNYPPQLGKQLIYGHVITQEPNISSYQLTCHAKQQTFKILSDFLVKVRMILDLLFINWLFFYLIFYLARRQGLEVVEVKALFI